MGITEYEIRNITIDDMDQFKNLKCDIYYWCNMNFIERSTCIEILDYIFFNYPNASIKAVEGKKSYLNENEELRWYCSYTFTITEHNIGRTIIDTLRGGLITVKDVWHYKGASNCEETVRWM